MIAYTVEKPWLARGGGGGGGGVVEYQNTRNKTSNIPKNKLKIV